MLEGPWLGTAVAALIMGLAGVFAHRTEQRRLRKQYWGRPCTGLKWRRQFPDAPKDEIRKFLGAFADCFSFKKKFHLKFEPGDTVTAIYRTCYPETGWVGGGPDCMELEDFALVLDRDYGINCEAVGYPEITLGQLFALTRGDSNRKAAE